jgi:hypothetical protein
MAFIIIHHTGAMERVPDLGCIDAVLSELEADNPEHGNVSVSDEEGWVLSAFTDWRMVWENVNQGEPRHLHGLDRWTTTRLMVALAERNRASVDREPWLAGYA